MAVYSQDFARQDVRAQCGWVEGHGSPELSAKFKTVLPSDSYLWRGKKYITGGPYSHDWTGVRLPRT